MKTGISAVCSDKIDLSSPGQKGEPGMAEKGAEHSREL